MYVTAKVPWKPRRKLGDSSYGGYVNMDPSIPGSSAQLLMDTGSATGLDPLANCSWWDQLMYQWGFGNLSCMTPSANAAGIAQIQSVVTNATAANAAAVAAGQPAPYNIAAIQQVANQQAAQVPADTANVLKFYANNNPLTTTGVGIPWWVWAILGGGGLLLVLKK